MKLPVLIAAAFVVAVGLAACSDDAPPPAAAPASNPHIGEAKTAEEREALGAAQAFFAALETRDRAALLRSIATNWTSGAEFANEFGGTAAVRLVSLSLDNSRPTAPGTILVRGTIEVTPGNVPANWNTGRNERFVQLVNEGGTWKVAAIGG